MRKPEERFFETVDGTRLFYRHWPAIADSANRAIVLLHRGHEHSGRFQHVVDELNLPGFPHVRLGCARTWTFVREQRKMAGLRNLRQRSRQLRRSHFEAHGIPAENLAVIGQSIGAVLAAAWAHDYAPKIRCMVLAAPAFQVKLYVPFARAGPRAHAQMSPATSM